MEMGPMTYGNDNHGAEINELKKKANHGRLSRREYIALQFLKSRSDITMLGEDAQVQFILGAFYLADRFLDMSYDEVLRKTK